MHPANQAASARERERERHEHRTRRLVLGFPEPDIQGEITAELERLRESDTVRVVDALAVNKDAGGEFEVARLSTLTDEEAMELGREVDHVRISKGRAAREQAPQLTMQPCTSAARAGRSTASRPGSGPVGPSVGEPDLREVGGGQALVAGDPLKSAREAVRQRHREVAEPRRTLLAHDLVHEVPHGRQPALVVGVVGQHGAHGCEDSALGMRLGWRLTHAGAPYAAVVD